MNQELLALGFSFFSRQAEGGVSIKENSAEIIPAQSSSWGSHFNPAICLSVYCSVLWDVLTQSNRDDVIWAIQSPCSLPNYREDNDGRMPEARVEHPSPGALPRLQESSDGERELRRRRRAVFPPLPGLEMGQLLALSTICSQGYAGLG